MNNLLSNERGVTSVSLQEEEDRSHSILLNSQRLMLNGLNSFFLVPHGKPGYPFQPKNEFNHQMKSQAALHALPVRVIGISQ
eukprot:scaffold4802_cov267-Chaetoceros_neogracile.AAC.36